MKGGLAKSRTGFAVAGLLFYVVVGLLLPSVSRAAVIVAFGDSITAGEGSGSGGYPPKLEALLNGNNRASSIANHGKGGENTSVGVSRFDSVVSGSGADFVLILEGTNDIWFGISLETTKYNLGEMIRKSRANNATPVISNLLPDSSATGWHKNIESTFNPMIRELASNNGVHFVDQYSALVTNWGSWNVDGKHPNDSGYWVMADTWYATLSSLIGEGGQSLVGSGDGDDGFCFIATAAFGSQLEPHVRLLREFRDICLLPTNLGRQFVEFYYSVSPPLADFIARHSVLRFFTRLALYPFVMFSYFILKCSLAEKVAAVGLAFLVGMLFFRYRAAARRAAGQR